MASGSENGVKGKGTGTPGAPDATASVDGNYLPSAPARFGGEIGLDAKDSKPFWPARVVPPKGAPNVLLIMTDDQGYGISSTFGGVIPTPTLDRIAKAGLRYTQFHSTSLCSPSRAALLTGRNHHSRGLRRDRRAGHRLSRVRRRSSGGTTRTIGEILKENGYATSWFGKNHNTPGYQYSLSGPFDQWPSGMGFDYFYGFMGGETDQWTPWLFRDHTQIFPVDRAPRLQPDHRHGRRGDQAHQGAERRGAGSSRSSSTTRPAARTHRISPRRNGSRSSGVHVRQGLERAARADLRQSEAARRDPGEYPAHALAGRTTRVRRSQAGEMGHAQRRREEALRSPGRRLCRLRRLHRPRDRPRDPGRSRTWASSTTR